MKIEIFTSDMVKPLRDKLGWNQQELAGYIECGPRSISNWENGKVKKMSRSFRIKFLELQRKVKKL